MGHIKISIFLSKGIVCLFNSLNIINNDILFELENSIHLVCFF
jgi:hypothetical protein